MPSPFDGKWRLESTDDVSAFFEASKAPEGHKAKMLQLVEALKKDPNFYVEELKIDGDKLSRKKIIGGQTAKEIQDAPFNQEVETVIDDGRQAKVKVVKEGENKVVRIQNVDGVTITGTFEVHGDTLTLKQTCGSATATQVFKKIP